MRTFFFGAVGVLLLVAVPRSASAEGPDEPQDELRTVLGRLVRHADQLEQMKQRGSYTIGSDVDELDGGGKVGGHKKSVVHVTATDQGPVSELVSYFENGQDKTSDARARAQKAKREKKKRPDFHLPFLASEQSRYAFAITDHDAADPRRVRLTFSPKAPAEDAFKGSAWVDAEAGEVLTMGFSPTKNQTFVDHIDITVRFDNVTPIGRAPSMIDFDARGSFLFVKRHYRGRVAITDTRVTR